MINLQEAFTKLNMFESEEFDIQDEKSREAMEDFLSDDESVEANDVDIIDPQAENEFDLEDSYVGKIVVQCPVCKSLLFRLPEEMEEKKDEEETCPYCYSVEVMEPIGKIVGLDEEKPIEKATADDVEPVEECALHEDLENVTIETENEVINVSAEDKNECPECDDMEKAEVIAPLNDVESEEEEEEGEEENEEEITDFDEESFDDMAESFFRENYENVKSFKATKGYDKGNHMVIEGILTLTNGKKKLTEFRVRPGKFRANGTATCLIENLQLNKKKIVNVRLGKTMTESKRKVNEGIFGKNKDKAMNTYQDSDEDMYKKGARYKLVTSSGTKYYKTEKEARDACTKLGGQLYGAWNKGKFDKEIQYGGK